MQVDFQVTSASVASSADGSALNNDARYSSANQIGRQSARPSKASAAGEVASCVTAIA